MNIHSGFGVYIQHCRCIRENKQRSRNCMRFRKEKKVIKKKKKESMTKQRKKKEQKGGGNESTYTGAPFGSGHVLDQSEKSGS